MGGAWLLLQLNLPASGATAVSFAFSAQPGAFAIVDGGLLRHDDLRAIRNNPPSSRLRHSRSRGHS